VVVVPADWVPGPLKLAHWRTLLAARAIENTAYVVASGQVPPDGIGASTVLAPDGQVLAELGEAVGVAVAQLDAERIAAVRRTNPSLELRRYAVVPRTDDVSPSRA
jgi:predicted amidohydrolase